MEALMIQTNQQLNQAKDGNNGANTGFELNTVGMPSQMESVAGKKILS